MRSFYQLQQVSNISSLSEEQYEGVIKRYDPKIVPARDQLQLLSFYNVRTRAHWVVAVD